MDFIETPIAGRDLEALAIETHRAVGAALLALDLDAEGRAQLIAPGALAPDVGASSSVWRVQTRSLPQQRSLMRSR